HNGQSLPGVWTRRLEFFTDRHYSTTAIFERYGIKTQHHECGASSREENGGISRAPKGVVLGDTSIRMRDKPSILNNHLSLTHHVTLRLKGAATREDQTPH